MFPASLTSDASGNARGLRLRRKMFGETPNITRETRVLHDRGVLHAANLIPREVEFYVGAFPGFGEFAVDDLGRIGFVLRTQTLFEAEQAPAVARPAMQVFTKYFLSFEGSAQAQHRGAQRGPHG